MKLIRSSPLTVAAAAVALACGCSTPSSTAGLGPKTSQTAPANVTGTTNLMSAQMAGPAPKVGKAHLVVDDKESSSSVSDDAASDAPKTARRSDGSRRGGGFGSTK